jgi:hypothetical protein
MDDDYLRSLLTDGFALIPNLLSCHEVEGWLSAWREFTQGSAGATILQTHAAIYGARDLIRDWPKCLEMLANPLLIEIVTRVLGAEAALVRVLFFDKPPERSWSLPWHRDLSIAVQDNSLPSENFTKPTRKHGVPHVVAPHDLLEKMLTLRVHLDDVTLDNGPLQVQVGSHMGHEEGSIRTILCNAGDALMMRPLILHASGESTIGTAHHRRILHFEFAAMPTLADGYYWRDFIPLTTRSSFCV